MNFKRLSHKQLYLFILIASSLVTHFLFFGHPRETVFDEVHFGKFISGYFTHEYFFDIHPPLGKLLISGVGRLTDFKPGFSFSEIGQQFSDNSYLWLRLLPTLAGVLLPIIIFLLAIELGLSPLAAFAGGIMVTIENGLVTQSRLILLDPFLILFGFTALLFYFIYKRSSSWIYLLFSGIVASLAISVKWTGLTFLAIIGVLYLTSWLKSSDKLWGLVRGTFFLVAVPATIYFAVFAVHFSLLTKSGPGDAFMTPEFRKTLQGSNDSTNPELKPLSIGGKFKELNIQMYESNATLTAGHPYSSKWYTWPFMIRPIYYWYESATTDTAGASRIYFLGNPVIWWASTVAILYLLLSVLNDLRQKIRPKLPLALLSGAYLLNMLPFVGISRAMFLYHYLIGLILSIITLVLLIDKLANKKRIFTILLAASLVAFIFFSPLTYGLPLSESSYNLRNWLKTWI